MTIPEIQELARAIPEHCPADRVAGAGGQPGHRAFRQHLADDHEHSGADLKLRAATDRRGAGDAVLPWLDSTACGAFHDADVYPCSGGRAVIEPMITAFALTLARVGTFIQILPMLGGPNVPRTVKVGLSLAISILLFTNEAGTHAVGISASWVGFGVALGREMLAGWATRLRGRACFCCPPMSRRNSSRRKPGLSMASILTATADGNANSLTVFFELLASLVFFALGFASCLSVGLARNVSAGADRPGFPVAQLGPRHCRRRRRGRGPAARGAGGLVFVSDHAGAGTNDAGRLTSSTSIRSVFRSA